jgi:1,2-diacylglycerol 3-beta-galactosyltransferase
MNETLPEVLVLTVDAGGGHRAAATALVAAAEARRPPFRFHVENIQDVFRDLDLVRRWSGVSVEGLYNTLQRRRLTLLMEPLLRLLHFGIRLKGVGLRREMIRLLVARRPAAVVSVVPNFNGVIRDAVASLSPRVPFTVVLTDYADFPPHFWIEPGLDRVVVGSDRAAEQARALGFDSRQVVRASGMLLHPRFYPRAGVEERRRVRQELGFSSEDFVVLVLFGGKGSPELEPLCEALLREAPGVRVIALSGQNPALARRIDRVAVLSGGRLRSLGFSDRVAELLASADLLCSKPGPGSIAEALHQGVPVLVSRNRHTIPQERFNAVLVDTLGVGVVVKDWQEMPAKVLEISRNSELRERLRRAVAALPPNGAVFEVLELVEELIRGPA